MEEWVKIDSFESQYQAEITKGYLEKNDVRAVILNAKDSLFLLGEYELYVNKDNEKKAQAILDEYKGITKVDSFVMRGPVERLKDVLEDNGISSQIKVSSNPRYALDNYELYVNNSDLKKAIPYVTGQALAGWSVAKTCTKVSQTRYRVEILNYHHIPSIVIKKRDTRYMKTEISIYVQDADLEKANDALESLAGYALIESVKDMQIAQIHEKTLANQGIRSLAEPGDNGVDVYVEADKTDEAKQIISDNKKWKLAATYSDKLEADYAVALLENFEIEAVTVAKSDITMAVDIDLFVEEFDLDDATDILKSLSVSENE